MMKKFGYTNALQVPRLEKIVINMGVGEAVNDSKKTKNAAEELALIAGQKPIITKSTQGDCDVQAAWRPRHRRQGDACAGKRCTNSLTGS